MKLFDHLHEKEKKAYVLLESEKVVRDSALDPVLRVAMRELKDFARQIEVKLAVKELFWRWFLVPVQEIFVVLVLDGHEVIKAYICS